MLLSELFTELSFIEFANLSVSEEASGRLSENSHARFVTSVNEALMELHKRFLLNEKELVLQTLPGKKTYALRKQHALTDDTRALKYIVDTDHEPFEDDLIHILSVHDENGCRIPLNDQEDCFSAFTPSVDVIQISDMCSEGAYFVSYRAAHPKLEYDDCDPEASLEQDIIIPLALKSALRQKIAANLFGSLSGQEFSTQAQAFEAKFEASCATVNEHNLVGPRDFETNTKLERRGFQ